MSILYIVCKAGSEIPFLQAYANMEFLSLPCRLVTGVTGFSDPLPIQDIGLSDTPPPMATLG